MTTEEKAKKYDDIMRMVASSLRESAEAGDEGDVDFFGIGEDIVERFNEDRPIIPKENNEGD